MATRRKIGYQSKNLGWLFGGLGALGDGGGVEAVKPGDVAFDDPSFDAESQTRFKAASPVRNFLSGGRGTAKANELNTQQILNQQDNEIGIRTNLTNARNEADVELDKELRSNKQNYGIRVNRLASAMANEEDPTLMLGPDDDIPESFRANARGKVANYGGADIEKSGMLGTESEVNARNASTDYTREHTTDMQEQRKNPKLVDMGDGSFLDPKRNVIRRWVPASIGMDGQQVPGRYEEIDATIAKGGIPTTNPGAKPPGIRPPKPDGPGPIDRLDAALTPDEGNTAIIPSAVRSVRGGITGAVQPVVDKAYNVAEMMRYGKDSILHDLFDSGSPSPQLNTIPSEEELADERIQQMENILLRQKAKKHGIRGY